MARIGLVLGAGGVVGGAFHAGVLSALADATGWDPRDAEVIVGTSAGSVTAASLRAGLPAADVAARAEGRRLSPEGTRLLRRSGPPPTMPRPAPGRLRGRAAQPGALVRVAMRPWSARPGSLAAAMLPAGTASTDIIADAITPLFGDHWPERALWVCAVRLRDGRRVVFGRDGAPTATVAYAVASSCAIPAYFAPVEIDGERYVDGGVHSLVNLDVAAGLGLDLVVVSSPLSSAGRGRRVTSDMALRGYARTQLGLEARRVRARGSSVIAFQPTAADLEVMGMNAMDPARRAPVTARVRESTLRRLERADVGRRLAVLGS